MATTTTSTTEKAEELLADLTAEVEALRTSEGWKDWLAYAARFHKYSANNVMLIALQRPDATDVMGYGAKDRSTGWLSVGRQVRKGETGIRILRPNLRWITDEDANGNDQRRQIVTGFGVVSVFDVSQTDGDDLPITSEQRWRDALSLAPTSERAEANYRALSGAAETLGFRVIEDDVDLTDSKELGYWTPGTTEVHVRRASFDQMAAVLVHELTHALDPECPGDKAECELVAESSAWYVSDYLGMDHTAVSTVYLAHFQGETDKLVSTASRTVKLAQKIIEALDIEEETK